MRKEQFLIRFENFLTWEQEENCEYWKNEFLKLQKKTAKMKLLIRFESIPIRENGDFVKERENREEVFESARFHLERTKRTDKERVDK